MGKSGSIDRAKRIGCLAVWLVAVQVAPVSAEAVSEPRHTSAGDLMDFCISPVIVKGRFCDGYIRALYDVSFWASRRGACQYGDLSERDFRHALLTYISMNFSLRDEDAVSLVEPALAGACLP